LQIGGGIRAYTDSAGRSYSALDVAARYFRAGADKVSIGSDAVLMAEAYWTAAGVCAGDSAIEVIARQYGRQAVVVSIDPRRVYVDSPTSDPTVMAAGHVVIPTARPGPRGEGFCWYQCTIKGGREGRPLCAHLLAQAVEALGAGELLVNCVDNDGQKAGYDEELLASLRERVSIPLIASSGAGAPGHFVSVFRNARVEAALAAGIFHRREVGIADVKEVLAADGLPVRQSHAAAAAL
jgi:glutamine amidotransferase/cyclase